MTERPKIEVVSTTRVESHDPAPEIVGFQPGADRAVEGPAGPQGPEGPPGPPGPVGPARPAGAWWPRWPGWTPG
jgi:hypothetical protein